MIIAKLKRLFGPIMRKNANHILRIFTIILSFGAMAIGLYNVWKRNEVRGWWQEDPQVLADRAALSDSAATAEEVYAALVRQGWKHDTGGKKEALLISQALGRLEKKKAATGKEIYVLGAIALASDDKIRRTRAIEKLRDFSENDTDVSARAEAKAILEQVASTN